MIEITLNSAYEGLRAVVEEAGEGFIYRRVGLRCVYVSDDAPSCLVGRFLHSIGVPLEELKDADRDIAKSARQLIHHLQGTGVVSAEPGVDAMLHAAQEVQDSGETWGYALRVAEEYLK